MNYKIFDPKVSAPLHTLSRKEAELHFNHFINSIEERISQLHLIIDGKFELNSSDKSLLQLGEFLTQSIKENENIKGEPSGLTFSICNDIAMFLSQLIISKSRNVSWKLSTFHKKDVSYQRPVLMGFQVKNKNYNLDLDMGLCKYAWKYLSDGVEENDLLLRIYQHTLKDL